MNCEYVTTFKQSPLYNMALDEYLFGRVVKGDVSFFLRLYTWEEGAITFGYNQNLDTAFDSSKTASTKVIRRITGGRALYHDSTELTYSIGLNLKMMKQASKIKPDIGAQLYISKALVKFLDASGIKSDFLKSSNQHSSISNAFHKAPCFASQARYEIMAGKRKIVASAQRIIEHSIFQHGAIKLKGIPAHEALQGIPGESQAIDNKEVTLREFERYSLSFKEVFQERFGCKLVDTAYDEKGDESLKNHLDYVKRNLLERREIIEHNQSSNSL